MKLTTSPTLGLSFLLTTLLLITTTTTNGQETAVQPSVTSATANSATGNNNNSNKPTYTIVAPAKIRPSSDYHVSLQLTNATSAADIEVEVSGPSHDGPFNRVTKSVAVNPSETRILNLEIGEWSKGNYKLLVKGRSGEFNFNNETALGFEPKSTSIFVQTDKAIYKPGQAVKFRAIVVNPSLIPNVAGTLDIYIKDSKDNLIKQWKRIFPQRGVVSEELQLSEQPPLGDWSITVDVQGQRYSKTFTVAEYVLPTFAVDVRLPPYATYNRSDVVATVKATYTYGKPVKGEVTLTVQPKIRHSSISFRPLEQFQTKMRISEEGSVDIPVNIVRDLNLKTDFFEREIEFFALVEEGLTGRKYNSSSVMKIYHKEVKVELIKTSKTFKPGLRYTAYLKVAYQDDKPVDDGGPPVTLKYGYSYNDANWTNVLEVAPVKGLIRVDLYPPKSDDKVFIIGWRAEYRGQTYYLDSVDCAQSPSSNFLQVIHSADAAGGGRLVSSLMDAQTGHVGEELTFTVNATEPLKDVVYEVMAKGDIVLARSIRQSSPSSPSASSSGNSFELTIPITHRMAPKARLLVYYVREENQEVVADALNFKVEGVFKTPVLLSSNVNQTKPGGRVEVTVATKPSAYVGLLGIDQSVLLLKSGNDLTQEDVMEELESYDIGKKGVSGGGGNPWSSGWFFRPTFWSGSSTAAEIFEDSGVVILTNGVVFREVHTIYRLYNRMGVSGLGKRIFYNADGEGVLVFKKARPQARKLDSIRLDDTILEDQLQPPTSFKVAEERQARIVLRKEFPETWIWANVTTGLDGVARYADKIPDTITSWYISAFAVDAITGLGVAESPLKVAVFRPFFLKLSLPYSIIRGESVSLQVLVFNYQSKAVQAEVVMENAKGEFEFTSAANEIEFAGSGQSGGKLQEVKEKRKTVTIPPFDGVSVSFLITPKKLGHIDVRVVATSENAGDAVVRKLLVKPEGQTQYFNKAMFIKLDAGGSGGGGADTVKRNFSVEVPPNAVPGSVRVKVSGISDILGPTVNHIDDLLRMPYGCGEQNMINLVPNIVVLNYLTRVNRLTGAIKAKAVKHIETGYQRELTYRREDGSFSAFGNSDRAGSTWLTAFVVKSFFQARPYVDVDPAVTNKAVEWLLTRQKRDGSFAEYGEVHNKALQGGAALKYNTPSNSTSENKDDSGNDSAGALTAYVLIAILHEGTRAAPERAKHESALKRAEDYVYSRLSVSGNPYEIAIIAQALSLAESAHADYAFKKLKSLAKRDGPDGLIHWPGKAEVKKPSTTSNETSTPAPSAAVPPTTLERIRFVSDYLSMPDPLEVEATAYALLTLVQRSDTDTAIPTLRWLVSKQNSNGGFSSTQDTVIGLQALGAIAQAISTSTLKMAVAIKEGGSADKEGKDEGAGSQQQPLSFNFHPENALVLQQIELKPRTQWVEVTATGFGAAILQVSYQYNIAVSAERPAFFLSPQKDKTSTENYLQLSICTYYKDGNSTNMAVMEVELPSGYNADVDALPAATRAKEVKRVDTANNDGTVFVYFDRVTRDELCITVPAHRTHRVANNKPVPVTIYDYYDRSKLSRIFYEPTLVTVNDVVKAEVVAEASTSSSSAASPTTSTSTSAPSTFTSTSTPTTEAPISP